MMEYQMFCFQCEQTAGCSGCTGKAGVCGKSAETAKLQDELTGALIGLARACAGNSRSSELDRLVLEGLFTTVTNVNFNEETLRTRIAEIHAEAAKIAPYSCLLYTSGSAWPGAIPARAISWRTSCRLSLKIASKIGRASFRERV